MDLRGEDPRKCPVCEKDLRSPAEPSLQLTASPGAAGREPELVQKFCSEDHLATWVTVSVEADQGESGHNGHHRN